MIGISGTILSAKCVLTPLQSGYVLLQQTSQKIKPIKRPFDLLRCFIAGTRKQKNVRNRTENFSKRVVTRELSGAPNGLNL